MIKLFVNEWFPELSKEITTTYYEILVNNGYGTIQAVQNITKDEELKSIGFPREHAKLFLMKRDESFGSFSNQERRRKEKEQNVKNKYTNDIIRSI